MSTLAQQIPSLADPVERRFYPRVVPQAPIFLVFSENGAADSLLLNISENGLLVSAPVGLPRNLVTHLSIPLNGLPNPVRVTVRVTWASEEGNLAGIQLLDLSEHNRQQIRKWGEHESARSSQADPAHSPVVVPACTNSSEPAGATRISGRGDVLSGTAREIGPVVTPLTVRFRPVSSLTRRIGLAAAIVVACLATVVLLLKASPVHRFVSSRASDSRSESTRNSSAASTAESQNVVAVQPPSTAITAAKPATVKSAVSGPRVSQQIEPASAGADMAASPIPATINPDDESTREPSPSLPPVSEAASIPAPALAESPATAGDSVSAPLHSAVDTLVAKTTTITPDLSSTIPLVPTPTPILNSPAAPSGNPSANVPANAPANLAVVPRPAPSLRPGTPTLPQVIHMDAPPARTLEVRLPSGYQVPFVNLPDERILESPTVTMHIQRSVHIAATGWASHRYKKVVVGELISRVDPPPTQIATGSAAVVKVRATITKEGRLGSVNLILGPPALVPAVANALREWRYQPTMVDGKPAETQSYIVFQFHAPAYRGAKRENSPIQ